MVKIVTVIIPCYNHANYLSEAINSVLAQTFTDWEALIIDDGSIDNTREVAAQFADPRIRYIYQQNRGLSGARNTGLKLATGNFIALLDADDMWAPTFLEKTIAALEQHEAAGAVYCGFVYMNANGQLLKQEVSKVISPELFRAEMIQQGNWLVPCAVVGRAEVYRDTGSFDETLHACEDLDMWWRISEKYQFVGIPEALVLYRRAGSNMSDDPDRMSRAFRMVIEKHFGSIEIPIEQYRPEVEKLVYRMHMHKLQGFLARGDEAKSAESLVWFTKYAFEQVNRLNIWYTLACVHQLIGQRGDMETWQPEQGEQDVLTLLKQAAEYDIEPQRLHALYAQAYLALAWLNYKKGIINNARRHLWHSLRNAPYLGRNGDFRRLAVRLLPGIPFLGHVKKAVSTT